MKMYQLFDDAFDNANYIEFKLNWRDQEGSFRKITKYKLKAGKVLATRCLYADVRLLLIGSRFGTFVIREGRTYLGTTCTIQGYWFDSPVGFYESTALDEITRTHPERVKDWLKLSVNLIERTNRVLDQKTLCLLLGMNTTRIKQPNIGQYIEELFGK